MQEVLIFSGTSEGRKLAEQLLENQIAATVCVATDYGQEVMEQEIENPLLEVQSHPSFCAAGDKKYCAGLCKSEL